VACKECCHAGKQQEGPPAQEPLLLHGETQQLRLRVLIGVMAQALVTGHRNIALAAQQFGWEELCCLCEGL